MRHVLIFLILILSQKVTNNNLISFPFREQTKIEKLLNDHIEFAEELYQDSLITIEPQRFAKMLLVMTYCESGLRSDVISKDGFESHGIYQFTKATRNYLKIPDIKHATTKEQNKYYRKYIEMVGKKKTQRIKTLVDLHAMNYTPKNMFKNILSTRGAILVRSDLIEFEERRVKENKEILKIYNEIWNG